MEEKPNHWLGIKSNKLFWGGKSSHGYPGVWGIKHLFIFFSSKKTTWDQLKQKENVRLVPELAPRWLQFPKFQNI